MLSGRSACRTSLIQIIPFVSTAFEANRGNDRGFTGRSRHVTNTRIRCVTQRDKTRSLANLLARVTIH